MRYLIKVMVNNTAQYIAADTIAVVRPTDRYRPDQNATIVLKDGTTITTDWTDNVESVATAITQALR